MRKNKLIKVLFLMLGQIITAPLTYAQDMESTMASKLKAAFPGALEISSLVVPKASQRYFAGCTEHSIKVILPIRSLSYPAFDVSCLDTGLSRRVRARASGSVKAVFSTTRISRGQTILGSQIALKEMPLRTYRQNLIFKEEEVFGRKVKRHITERSWVLESDLEKRYDIQAGELFSLTVVKNGIHFSMDAQALEGGVVGQTINAKNLNSGEVFRVSVTKRGEATLK